MFQRAAAIVILLTASTSATAFGQPVIQHQQVLKASLHQEIEFTALVTDSSEVTAVELYYRAGNTTTFSWLRLSRSGNRYSVRLPKELVTLAGIDYYLSAVSRSGKQSTLPAAAPGVYYEVIVRDDQSHPYLLSRYPDDQDTVYTQRPEIRIGYFDDATIDRRRIRLLIDSADVTVNSRVLPSNISYTPPQMLDTGTHTITVIIPDGEGNTANNATWSFVVRPSLPDNNPLLLQSSVSSSYGHSRGIPAGAVQRTYGADVVLHASQKIGGMTLSSNVSLHTDQTLFPSVGKKTARLQGFSLSAAESPVSLYYGDFSENFSEYGMSNNQLTGGQAFINTGPFSSALFTGMVKDPDGTRQDFSGGRVSFGWENGSSLSSYVVHGKDDTADAAMTMANREPISGTVVGISGSFPSVAGADISFEGAKSFSTIKELDATTDDPGVAGTITAAGTVAEISLNSSVSFADRSFHNPGNPYLEHDQITGSFTAGGNIASVVATSVGLSVQRTGLSGDTVYQPTNNSTYSFSVNGNPSSLLSVSASYSLATQRGAYSGFSAKNNRTHHFDLSTGVNFSDADLSLSLGIDEKTDYSAQQQGSLQTTYGASMSATPLERFSTSMSLSLSGSTPQSSSVTNHFFSLSGSMNYGLDAMNANTISCSVSFSDNSASDASQKSSALSVALAALTNFGVTSGSAPQLQISSTWSRSSTVVPARSVTEDIQVYLSLSWVFNSSL